ncbi:hypothetical protein CR513_47348, partial [Mucuna pruriens]
LESREHLDPVEAERISAQADFSGQLHAWCINHGAFNAHHWSQLKFHGLASEDPHKHLKEFHVGILEDHIKMKALPFSLDGAAKDWLYLQLILFNTWGGYEVHVPREILPSVQNRDHKERDLQDQATLWRDTT